MNHTLKKSFKKIVCFTLCLTITAVFSSCGGALTGFFPSGGDGGGAETGANAEAGAQAPDWGGQIAGALTISAYDSMIYKNVLETAAQAFAEAHPGVEVDVATFSAMPEIKRQESADGRMAMMAVSLEENPQERADYANKVNTLLMSGEGADILAADVIPIAKYVESGLLENLAPYMEQDPGFDRSDYRANILDAVTWKNGTWFLPMDYMYNYYTYDTTLLAEGAGPFGAETAYTSEQLLDIAIPSFDGETMLFNTPAYTKGGGGGMWSRILRERWPEFVDIAEKKANFKDGGFAELLNKVKAYGDSGYVPANFTGRMEFSEEDIAGLIGQAPTDRYYFKPKGSMSLFSDFMRGSQSRMMNFTYGGGASAIEDDDEIAGIAANADGSVPFTYTQAYAINSNSKNKRAAWEFIKYMLSGEMQASGVGVSLRGLPLHNATRANQIQNMMTSMAARTRGNAAFGGAAAYGGGSSGGAIRSDTVQAPAGGDAVNGGDEIALKDGEAANGGGEAALKDGGDALKTADGDDAPGGGGDAAAADGGDPQFFRTPVENAGDAAAAEIDPEVVRKYNEATERFSDQINTFEIKDAIIDDMIAQEVHYFFEGEKTAEEVAAALQSKVELYLNE